MNNPIKYLRENVLDDINGHSFLAEGLMQPFLDKTNSNRAVMWCSHISQAPILANEDGGETPLVNTRFENQTGKHSSGYKKADKDFKILGKFVRNEYNYFLLIYNYKDKTYDVIERKECEWITERYGYKNNNFIDNVEIGDKVKKGQVLYANTSYDDEMNLCYGRNLKAVFYSDEDWTHEDAIVIGESAAKKLNYFSVKKPKININTNDILLNTCGNKNYYKCFPDIGEEVGENQILTIRRRNQYDTMLTNLRNLRKYKQGDTVFYCKGRVVDIKVFCNSDVDKLRTIPYYKQIVKYIDMDRKYCERVVENLEDILENKPKQCSYRLIDIYNECKMKLDEGNYYEFDNNRFDNIVIEFTIMDTEKAEKAIKLAGRFGNKGVISKIVPDEYMPTVCEGPLKGTTAEICLNPLGVINRMNPSQLYEQEINFIGLWVRNKLKELLEEKDIDSCNDMILKHYEMLNKTQQEFTKEFLSELDEDENIEFIENLIEHGIPVHQPPFFGNIDIFDLTNMYTYYQDKLGLTKCKFSKKTNKGETRVLEKEMVIGELYMIRLKHQPKNKSSMRSTNLRDLTNLPAKDRSFKEYKSLYPHTPIKWGEQEVMNSFLTEDKSAIKELLNSYGVDSESENILEENLLLGNPFDINIEFPEDNTSKTMEVNKELFYAIGIEMVDFDAEEYDEDDLDFEEDDESEEE